ncbi:MAG: hypothetical protein JNM84_12805 [Planctomycetes bacterium]|nr:hypothetical protein [Planctomycetota bacterium]
MRSAERAACVFACVLAAARSADARASELPPAPVPLLILGAKVVGASSVLELRFPASASWVTRLRLYVEPSRVPGWNQIDAVELRGFPREKG